LRAVQAARRKLEMVVVFAFEKSHEAKTGMKKGRVVR
jgi:hypothetical protein